jgi:hypothetical protein
MTIGLGSCACHALVDLFATERTWVALAEEVAPHQAGYRFVSWTNVLPDELMDGYCALSESFSEEASIGDLALEREVWDASRVRDREALARKTGRNTVGTAAFAPDGSSVGFTEIVIRDASPQRGIQSGTLVPRPHRGHLGLAMKLVNHARAREQFPLCQRLITGNAGVNLHMNAVNDRLGYQVIEAPARHAAEGVTEATRRSGSPDGDRFGASARQRPLSLLK